jgi:multicomponent Na+:H+ antiporter subunit D
MTYTNETYLLLSLIIPLLAGLNSAVIRYANLRDGVNVLLTIWHFSNMIKVLEIFRATNERASLSLLEISSGLHISFSIEPLGMLFALIVSFLWMVSTVYSIGYMRGNNEVHQGRFYCFFALSIFSSIGIAFAGNLMTLFVFYELLTISTYPLVTHSGTVEAKKVGRVYLGILFGTSVLLLLPAIIITWSLTGTLDFTSGGILAGKISDGMGAALLFLFIFGIGKAALMPVHKWLPSAMIAPAPVSALLHAVAVVKAGVFTIVKVIIYIFGIDYLRDLMHMNWWHGEWLLYLASFTIIAASVVALKQDSLKRMLAYSTISQLSYVILAAAILSPKSIVAAAFHIAAHALGKITLFFAAGAIYTSAHKSKISQLSGVGKRMPWTMTAFTIAAISMIGIPPTVGFISKWYLVEGVLTSEMYWIVGVIILSTLLNTAYFLIIIYKAFFESEKISTGVTITSDYGEAPILMVIALMVTSIATIVLFFHPGVILELANGIVAMNVSAPPIAE